VLLAVRDKGAAPWEGLDESFGARLLAGWQDHYQADRHAEERTSTRQGFCDYLEADLRDTPTILAGAAETLDLTRPAAVLLLAVLHFITDIDDPAAIVATLIRQLAPGSFVVISHLTGDFAPGPVFAGVKAHNTLVPTTLVPRTHSQVSALLGFKGSSQHRPVGRSIGTRRAPRPGSSSRASCGGGR
jgi:hypothetical protein